MRSPDGRSYGERLRGLRTERELSELFEQMTARLPMGSGRLLAGLNPVRTAGPMQVSIDFAQRHARGYPYTAEGSIRHEVFTRRGGLYFGIKHLLDYPADYPRPIYRFADFNAGWYASRNAAFQQAAAIASGTKLVRDGDLLAPGAPMDRPGATEAALRSIDVRLNMDAAAIRADLELERSAAFDPDDNPGGFLQVSGLRYVIRGRTLDEVTVNGQPIDPERHYRVVMPDFLAEGGDGYAMLKELERRVDTGRLISDMLIEAFRAGGPAAPQLDGRIVRR